MLNLKSKKGDLPDMLIFLITAFILAIGLLILAFVVPKITDGLNTSGMNSSVEARGVITEINQYAVEGLQKGFLLLITGLIIGVMLSSFLIRTHPIFIFLYVLFLLLSVFIGGFIGNAFEQVAESGPLAETLASQGLISIVMQNIVAIVLFVGALSMIIIFAKFSSRGGNQAGNPL